MARLIPLSRRGDVRHFLSQMNVAFQEGASLSRRNLFFPFTLITSSAGFDKSRAEQPRARRAGGLSPRIAALLPLNPCDSESCDPLPLRRLAFDSCCQQ